MTHATVSLTNYTAKPLRGTGGKVFITESATGTYFGLFIPDHDAIHRISATELGILRWAISHPNTKDSVGWLRLSKDHFAHLDGKGGYAMYSRVEVTV